MTGQELSALYGAYLEEAERVERNRRPFDGVFGLGKRASDDPCHDRFLADVEAWIRAFRETEPDSAAVREVLSLLFRAPKEHPEPQSAYWVMTAAQGYAGMLIPRLSPADAAALVSEYSAAYARWERMPVQKQLLEALKKAAKG